MHELTKFNMKLCTATIENNWNKLSELDLAFPVIPRFTFTHGNHRSQQQHEAHDHDTLGHFQWMPRTTWSNTWHISHRTCTASVPVPVWQAEWCEMRPVRADVRSCSSRLWIVISLTQTKGRGRGQEDPGQGPRRGKCRGGTQWWRSEGQ